MKCSYYLVRAISARSIYFWQRARTFYKKNSKTILLNCSLFVQAVASLPSSGSWWNHSVRELKFLRHSRKWRYKRKKNFNVSLARICKHDENIFISCFYDGMVETVKRYEIKSSIWKRFEQHERFWTVKNWI